MTVLKLFVCAIILILPPVNPKRPDTSRLSRGPVWTSFQSLKLDAKQVAKATLDARQRKRIAIVAHDADGKQNESLVYAMLLASELSYHPKLLVTDFMTSRQIFAECTTVEACALAALKYEIDKVVWCSQQGNVLRAEILDRSSSDAPLSLADLNTQQSWLADVPQRRSELLDRLGLDSRSRALQVQSLPSQNIEALTGLARANVEAAALAVLTDIGAQKAGCVRAIEVLDAAIKNDPNLIEAYILKASCQDELGLEGKVKQTLRDAFSKRNSAKLDPLANLELEADYSRFCLNDIDAALERYSKMAEIDSANLRANWGLVDIILTGNGTTRPGPEDISEAAKFAAILISHHPQSGVAQAIHAQVLGK